jgi:NADH-quinone oxidoreductase subunit L
LAGIGIDGVFGFAGFYSKDLILESAIGAHTQVGELVYWLGIAAAFMTAFYSWRLIIMTFHGAPRADHHTMDHAHESPLVMLLPLVPLALGAIFAGWYAYDWFAGEGREHFWAGVLAVTPGHDSIEAAHHVDEAYKLLPLVVAFSGIFFAYIFYSLKPTLPAAFARALGGIYRAVYRKYYFDELYDFVFVRGARALGGFLWKKGDEGTIDRFGPDGVAGLAVRIAQRVATCETGYLYHYAFAMVIGVAGFISWFWLKG